MYEDLKREVIEAARKAEETGLCRPRSGNFSRIDDERRYILITPSGLDRMTMTEDDIIIIDRNLKILENKNNRRPSSESLMHAAAYEARPDINAAAHTHSPYALTFAILEKPVPPVLAESGHLGCGGNRGYIPVAAYGRQGSPALADSVKGPPVQGGRPAAGPPRGNDRQRQGSPGRPHQGHVRGRHLRGLLSGADRYRGRGAGNHSRRRPGAEQSGFQMRNRG